MMDLKMKEVVHVIAHMTDVSSVGYFIAPDCRKTQVT